MLLCNPASNPSADRVDFGDLRKVDRCNGLINLAKSGIDIPNTGDEIRARQGEDRIPVWTILDGKIRKLAHNAPDMRANIMVNK